jgi:hypothetical protein
MNTKRTSARNLSTAAKLFVALSLTFVSIEAAIANGLSSHLWITFNARTHVVESPLRDLVFDPKYEDMLAGGTMFPDGGYAVGDNYGELAHWEPFQLAYIDWIRSNFSVPWSEEAKKHIAFVLGMASHGMADQVFDSLYMERARRYDATSDWANKSMDEATDVCFMASVGAQTVPQRWLPVDTLVEIFKDSASYDVSPTTLNRGQSLVGLAVAVVGMLAKDPEAVADYQQQFPWATTHMQDPMVAGHPAQISTVVASYWMRIWKRLHEGSPVEDGMLSYMPTDHTIAVATSTESIDAWLTIVFPAHLKSESIPNDAFEILDEEGQSYDFTTWLFYRDYSHVLHLQPSLRFPQDQELTLHLRKDITNPEGFTITAPWSASFTTKRPVSSTEIEPPVDDADVSCTCATTTHASGLQSLSGIFFFVFLWFVRIGALLPFGRIFASNSRTKI